jgi:hypothetical protein
MIQKKKPKWNGEFRGGRPRLTGAVVPIKKNLKIVGILYSILILFTAVIRHMQVVENCIQILVVNLEDVGWSFAIYFTARSVSRPRGGELWDEWWIAKILKEGFVE